jgi:hypothetical protein
MINLILIQLSYTYEGCSKCIAYFYLETSNFKLVLCLMPFPVFLWGPPGLLATGSCYWVGWGLCSLNAAFPWWSCLSYFSSKVFISCPRSTPRGLEMQSFSRCIHFLKASRYADLGTVIRYWWMADLSACRDLYFRPARKNFNFGNKKKSHGARSGEYGGWGKTVTFSFFKNAETIAEVWSGALSCRRPICLKPVTGRRFL